jgi:hypothetical protein
MKAPKISHAGTIDLPGPPAGPPPSTQLLNVMVPEQDRTKWCWAAVGLGVRQAYGSSVNNEQCDIASEVLSDTCCEDSDPCNVGADVPPALGRHFEGQRKSKKHRTMKFVKDEINQGHPIAVQILRDSGGRHAVVISGYYDSARGPYLWICDPEDGDQQPCAFDKFKNDYDDDGAVWEISFKTDTGTVPNHVGPIDDFIFN